MARRIKAASRRSEDSVEASELGILNESTKMIGAAGYSKLCKPHSHKKGIGSRKRRERRKGKFLYIIDSLVIYIDI